MSFMAMFGAKPGKSTKAKRKAAKAVSKKK